jgi:hypothetical protein
MPYEVINLDTEESHGVFETLGEARGCVQFDRLRAYSIWQGDWDHTARMVPGQPAPEFFGNLRVESCEPYDGDDDRVKQALGQPNASEGY